jgi:hypothetical protein
MLFLLEESLSSYGVAAVKAVLYEKDETKLATCKRNEFIIYKTMK